MPAPHRAQETAGLHELLTSLDSCTELLGSCHPRTIAIVSQLAVALWCAGHIDRAIGLLDRALDQITSALGAQHPLRVEVLRTLGEILLDQRHLEQAGVIHREVLECCVQHAGANHPDSLAAKGDLAAVLFELGQEEEAVLLEREASESAREHLGKTHSITCVLAWNRAIGYERRGDLDAAQRLIASELAWLLAEEPACLEPDQYTIRTMLARRLNWDAATAC